MLRKWLFALSCLVLSISGIEAQTVTTTGGTVGQVPVFTGSSAVGSSSITVNGDNVGIGTDTPAFPLTLFAPRSATGFYGGRLATDDDSMVQLGKTPFMEIIGDGTANGDPDIGLVQLNIGSTDTNSYQGASELYLGATRATEASGVGEGNKSVVGSGDILGRIGFYGDDGTNVRSRGAIIDSEVYVIDQPVATGVMPAALNLATGADGPIIFYTNVGSGDWNQLVGNGKEKMRITYDGKVGIGTAAPSSSLEVKGGITMTSGSGGTITFPDGSSQGTAWTATQSNVVATGGAANTIPIFTGATTLGSSPIAVSGTSMSIAAGTNVGIGTTTPSSALTLAGFNSVNQNVTQADIDYPGQNLTFVNNVGPHLIGGIRMVEPVGFNLDAGDMVFSSSYGSPHESMRITAFGNVGIGGLFHIGNVIDPLKVLPVTGQQGAFFGWNNMTGTTGETDFINSKGLGSGGWAFINAGAASGSMGSNTVMFLSKSGNLGIGTLTAGEKLEVVGNMFLSQSGSYLKFQDGTKQTTAWTGELCGGDYAESINISGDRKKYEPGDLLTIDPDAPGKFLKTAEPYSTLVAGIYSTKPGVLGRRQTTPKDPDEVPMAVVGIVPTKVTAENGSVRAGDLLVASSTIGYAMKGTDRNRMLGAIVGKAMGNLDSGQGVIEVLVTLQ